jgi:putative tricarboxylic transport membrane protein
VPGLYDGVEFTVVLVALFAIGETIFIASRHSSSKPHINPLSGGAWMSREEWRRSFWPWMRGTVIGFPIGALPAGGSEIPTFLSYTLERRLSKNPKEFGHGAIEGVAGPEAANNSAAAGMLIPLLTLGLPTSATTAILLTAFQNYGLQPGPFLFTSNPDLVWGLIASLYVGNVMLLILNLPLAGIWVRLLLIPAHYLYAGILVFALIGVWGISTSVIHLVIMFVVGLAGYVMRVYDFPISPALIGLILGPLAEKQLRQALAIGQSDPSVLISTPLSIAFLTIALGVLVVPPLLRLRRPAAA